MYEYNSVLRRKDHLVIRLKRQKEFHDVEFFDGMRIDPSTIPAGKHMYHTRHDDYGNICTPVAIAPEGTGIVVNFCGTIVTDEALNVPDETKLMYVSWV